MPRPRKATTVLEDQALPGMDLDGDPTPGATRRGPGRPRKTALAPPVKAAGNRGRISTRSKSGRIVSKDAMIAKVREDVYTYASLLHAAWDFKDPECASVWKEPVESLGGQERLAALVDRLVGILARNDGMLAAAYSSGIFGEVAVIASIVFPAVKQVWRAHGPGGQGHATDERAFDVGQYPAYSPAAA